MIDSIKVTNFKSFDTMEARLGKLNVIIGANASGKSNFVNIFKFLKDVFASGLDNAIAMQGGVDCIQNINIGARKDLSVELHIGLRQESVEFPIPIRRNGKKTTGSFDPSELTYTFSVEFYKKKRGYVIKEERLEGIFDLRATRREKKELKKGEVIGKGKIILTLNKMGGFEFSLEPKGLPINVSEIFPFMRFKKAIPKVRARRSRKELILLGPSFGATSTVSMMTFFSPLSLLLRTFLGEMSLYDIDPRLSKRSTFITGKIELDSDGSNLASVLNNVLGFKKSRKRLSGLMKDLLPFIEDVSVEKLADRSLLPCLKESYCGKRFLPAPLISDGTINLTALIIALYFNKSPLIIIEEPERNIHPHLISKLVDMMKDVSERMDKQIIVTTHNPEVIKHVGIENIFLVYRDDGFSKVSKPAEKEEVRRFLKNKMGVDELFVQNMLQW